MSGCDMLAAATALAVFSTRSPKTCRTWAGGVAAKAGAGQVTGENLAGGPIYPPQSRILDLSLHVAKRIATYIFDRDLARVSQPPEIGELICSRIYRPVDAG
jgi:malate dehydrogenase (oxaloacetate-decarboxylating)(NADP+)